MKTSVAQLLLSSPVEEMIPDGEDLSIEEGEGSDETANDLKEGELELMSEPESPVSMVIFDTDLPGAPHGTSHPVIEVSEEDESKEKTKKEKEASIWDWESKGHDGFLEWVKERAKTVPSHRGYDSAGLERAHSYLGKLDDEISKAMRNDLDGKLDANHIESIREQIQKGVHALEERLEMVSKWKKNLSNWKNKKADYEPEMVKNAQKISGVKGVMVTVPLLISRIARVCINGHVSSGHSLKELYARQVKEYDLSKREQAEVKQLLADMGLPMWEDRGFLPDSDVDLESTDNMDFGAKYKS